MTMRRGTRAFLFLALVGTCGASLVVACVGDDPVGTGSDSGTPIVASDASVDTAVTPTPGPDTSTPVDANVADTNVADAAKTFCSTQIAPVGFTDFFCADFDGTGPVEEGFTNKTLSDGGVLSRTTAVAYSAPNALFTSALGTNRVGTLSWRKTGGATFTQAVLTARVNPDILGGVVPPGTGDVKLLEITSSNALAAVYYTAGGSVGGTANYTGYYYEGRAFGGGVALKQFPITTRLTSSTWTEVKLTWASTGAVTVAYNGVTVFTDSGFSSTDTALTFTVGSAGSGTTGAVPPHRFDDVMFAIRR